MGGRRLCSGFIRQTRERARQFVRNSQRQMAEPARKRFDKKMPKKYGVKEKDLVVSHILHLLLTGKLRSGDRVDRNEIALGLGVSRVPIQEALVQLEHDGIVSTRYHRGAFVERFDEATVLEHHELDGLLNGIASARAATSPTPRILGQLDTLMRSLRAAKDARAFSDIAAEYRRTVNDEYAGPRLHATIRASQNLIPACSGRPIRADARKYCRSTRTRTPRYTAAIPTPRGRPASTAPT